LLSLKYYKYKKRAGGIEPPSLTWKAKILPLNHARINRLYTYAGLKAIKSYKFSSFKSKNFAKSAASSSKFEIAVGS
jgi:hypothetical protein